MQFDTYIFDLYGTLVDIHTDEEKAELWEKLALFYGYYGADYEPQELKEAYARQVKCGEQNLAAALSRQGEFSSLEKKDDVHEAHPEIKLEYVFQKLYEEKGIHADLSLSIHTGQFFRVLSTEYIRLYEGARELLSALKLAGKKVYLLSNAQRIFTEYEIRSLGIFEYFDDIFISSECSVKKPDSRFFNMLIEKHQINTEKAIMIGNDLNSDIAGAKKVGLSTFYIHSNISPELPEDVLKLQDDKTEKMFKKKDLDALLGRAELADYFLTKMDLNKCKKMLLG